MIENKNFGNEFFEDIITVRGLDLLDADFEITFNSKMKDYIYLRHTLIDNEINLGLDQIKEGIERI